MKNFIELRVNLTLAKPSSQISQFASVCFKQWSIAHPVFSLFNLTNFNSGLQVAHFWLLSFGKESAE